MLAQWIINMNTCEASSQPFYVQDMVNILLLQ